MGKKKKKENQESMTDTEFKRVLTTAMKNHGIPSLAPRNDFGKNKFDVFLDDRFILDDFDDNDVDLKEVLGVRIVTEDL